MQSILGDQTLAFNTVHRFSNICRITHPNYFILGVLDAELGP